jgi:twitching motility protein PilT
VALEIQKYLEYTISHNASDLHLMVGALPIVRIDGQLRPISGEEVLTAPRTEALIFEMTSPEQKDLLLTNKEVDFSFALGEVARFRVNAFYEKGYLAASLRLIPVKIRTIEELSLPATIGNLARLPQGLVLVVGPTGHGKSTTLAALINQINETKSSHIVTIEDPIEYVYPVKRALIAQREMHLDTHSWEIALRSVLREDPDVVLVGEMRDFETISSALTIAETGHLVFATLHTNSAAQTIDRIIDVFPEYQQSQVRQQLSSIIEGVVSQRLIPAVDGGRIPAVEIMLANSAVRTTIREGKTHLLDNVIQTSAAQGMILLESYLANLVKQGKITYEEALAHTVRTDELERRIKGQARG